MREMQICPKCGKPTFNGMYCFACTYRPEGKMPAPRGTNTQKKETAAESRAPAKRNTDAAPANRENANARAQQPERSRQSASVGYEKPSASHSAPAPNTEAAAANERGRSYHEMPARAYENSREDESYSSPGPQRENSGKALAGSIDLSRIKAAASSSRRTSPIKPPTDEDLERFRVNEPEDDEPYGYSDPDEDMPYEEDDYSEEAIPEPETEPEPSYEAYEEPEYDDPDDTSYGDVEPDTPEPPEDDGFSSMKNPYEERFFEEEVQETSKKEAPEDASERLKQAVKNKPFQKVGLLFGKKKKNEPGQEKAKSYESEDDIINAMLADETDDTAPKAQRKPKNKEHELTAEERDALDVADTVEIDFTAYNPNYDRYYDDVKPAVMSARDRITAADVLKVLGVIAAVILFLVIMMFVI